MATDLGSAIGKIILETEDALKNTQGLGSALGNLAGPAAAMGLSLIHI